MEVETRGMKCNYLSLCWIMFLIMLGPGIESAVFMNLPARGFDGIFKSDLPGLSVREFKHAEVVGLPVQSFIISCRVSPHVLFEHLEHNFDRRFPVERNTDRGRILLTGVVENKLCNISISGQSNQSLAFVTMLLRTGPRDSSYLSRAPFLRFVSGKTAHLINIHNFKNRRAMELHVQKKLENNWQLEKYMGSLNQGGYFLTDEVSELFFTYSREDNTYIMAEYQRIPEP